MALHLPTGRLEIHVHRWLQSASTSFELPVLRALETVARVGVNMRLTPTPHSVCGGTQHTEFQCERITVKLMEEFSPKFTKTIQNCAALYATSRAIDLPAGTTPEAFKVCAPFPLEVLWAVSYLDTGVRSDLLKSGWSPWQVESVGGRTIQTPLCRMFTLLSDCEIAL
jgi:hypothetical protein